MLPEKLDFMTSKKVCPPPDFGECGQHPTYIPGVLVTIMRKYINASFPGAEDDGEDGLGQISSSPGRSLAFALGKLRSLINPNFRQTPSN